MIRALAISLALAALPAAADPHEVDLELFLAVDVSRSMTPAELEIQRRGYATALRSKGVAEAIQSGLLGEIAITYVEWAGAWSQRVVVPWTTISGPEGADLVARQIETFAIPGMRRTSISGALAFATDDIETNDYHGLRRVIDVSGDGPNNNGPYVVSARDRAVAAGITINGLPLMTKDGRGGRWHLDDLDEYYRHCVIGGPGAFVIPVTDWSGFADAVRRKLVLEIAGGRPAPERIWRTQSSGRTTTGYDCRIGEKIWERTRQDFGLP